MAMELLFKETHHKHKYKSDLKSNLEDCKVAF